jgi:RNA polymerase III transcription factor (TF)IIIC subunit HTH domain
MVKERPLWLRNEVIDAVAECYRFAVLDSLALIGYQLKDGPWRGYYVSYTLTHNCYVYKTLLTATCCRFAQDAVIAIRHCILCTAFDINSVVL